MPPVLPIALVVYFHNYTDPIFRSGYHNSEENLVPIVPVTSQSDAHGPNGRTRFSLKLCWAITIHKSQELTLNKVWTDLELMEKVAGLDYVALSRVRRPADLVAEPMSSVRLVVVKGVKISFFSVRRNFDQKNCSQKH